jgi:hypothetical protein
MGEGANSQPGGTGRWPVDRSWKSSPQIAQITQMDLFSRAFEKDFPKAREEKSSVSSVTPWWVLGDKVKYESRQSIVG